MSAEAFTLRSAAGLPNDPPAPSGAVVVVIDAQVEYLASGRLPLTGVDDAVGRIRELLDAARLAGTPIVHVVHEGPSGGLFDPEAGGRIIPEVTPADGEVIVTKRLPNAFAGTDLQDRLTELDRTELVVVGFMTHMCVSSTTRAALDLGYSTTVIGDAAATRSLPSTDAGADVAAAAVHAAALAALADRFCVVTDTASLLRRWSETEAST